MLECIFDRFRWTIEDSIAGRNVGAPRFGIRSVPRIRASARWLVLEVSDQCTSTDRTCRVCRSCNTLLYSVDSMEYTSEYWILSNATTTSLFSWLFRGHEYCIGKKIHWTLMDLCIFLEKFFSSRTVSFMWEWVPLSSVIFIPSDLDFQISVLWFVRITVYIYMDSKFCRHWKRLPQAIIISHKPVVTIEIQF